MDTRTIDSDAVVELFFLLLIGIGPKIALVPFLEVTAGMDAATKGRVIRKMLTTVSVVAAILIVFGEFLTRLLHFSTGALAVAGGVVLLIIAVSMVLGLGDGSKPQTSVTEEEPMKLAVFPLAIPYLLNPVGIVVLVTASAEAASVARIGLVIGVLAFVLGLDVVVFRWANKVGERLDESRLLVTEKVFGFLLAALAIELVLTGLDSVGVVQLSGH